VDESEWPARGFEAHRVRLRAVAYQMLGSLADADDAVQETWLRLARSDTSGVQNLGGWLTTVTARICLDMLRARAARREDPLLAHVPDPVIGWGPEQEALLADSVGLALLVVLDNLSPAGRLAFVLHDVFAVPFEEIAPILDRSPAAAKQLASRARRRLSVAAPAPDPAWCCAPTLVPGRWGRPGWCTARRRWPGRSAASPGSPSSHGRCWSTARPGSSPPRTGSRYR
jgi:RNA polymerase sigma factor (sigma-70 family)